jgi:hypothetical protein
MKRAKGEAEQLSNSNACAVEVQRGQGTKEVCELLKIHIVGLSLLTSLAVLLILR